MKVLHKKTFGFRHNKFTDKNGPYKLIADIYEDDAGYYEMCRGKNQLYCREDGDIKDWLVDIQNELHELTLLRDFLLEVETQNKNPKHKIPPADL